MMPATLKWKLLSLFVIGMVLFNFPIIDLFALKNLIFGIPSLIFYLFMIWLAFILILKHLVDPTSQKKQNKNL